MNANRFELNEVETTFINEWAREKRLDVKVNLMSCGALSDHGLDLADVHNVLRSGSVIVSDMLGHRGLWTVLGETTEDDLVELDIAVASEEGEVELLRLDVFERREME